MIGCIGDKEIIELDEVRTLDFISSTRSTNMYLGKLHRIPAMYMIRRSISARAHLGVTKGTGFVSAGFLAGSFLPYVTMSLQELL